MLLEALDANVINVSTNRRAMGYPESYVSTRIEQVSKYYSQLRRNSVRTLVEMVSDSNINLERRIAAGNLLALYGDPRINVDLPEMIEIPEARVKTGLPVEKVDEVLKKYSDLKISHCWIKKETPAHFVHINKFCISKYPVTNIEYLEYLKTSDEIKIPSSWHFGAYPHERSNHPVYSITAESADRYAQWLSKKNKLQFRLPTEAEWEYAAAGPFGFEFPWGNEFQKDYANTLEAELLCSTPVGVFSEGRSPFGVYDMAGNVEEFVSDYFYQYPQSKYFEHDDLSIQLGSYRVCRGGSFTRYKDLARTKRRHGPFPKDIYVTGFRLVQEI